MSQQAVDEAEPDRNGIRRRPAGWALGLPVLGLIWLVAGLTLAPSIEQEIRRATLQLGAGPGGVLHRYRAHAEVEGRDVVVLADLGLAEDARLAAEAAIRAIPGVRRVRTEVAVPVAMAPFTLTVRRDGAGISLVGGVGSPDDRVALVERAGTLVPPERVHDRLRLGTGAPPGFDAAARFLLSALASAESGEAVLADRTVRVRATTADSSRYEAVRAALRNPPPGFEVVLAEIEPPTVPVFTWSASREADGWLLSGHVPSEAQRTRLAERLAALGGARVRDEMRTAKGLAPAIAFDSVADAALAALAELQTGRADLTGPAFRFTGEGVDKGALPRIEASLRQALPRAVEVAALSVSAVAPSPFRSLARRSDGRLTLTGFVPSEAERRAAAAAMPSRYPGEILVDRRVVADGAPAGFAEAQGLALDGLAVLSEGEAAIRDREIRLSGRALYSQLAARLREQLPKSVPAGWSVSVELDPVQPEGALDAVACGDVLGDAARREPLRFQPGKPDPAPDSQAVLERHADIVRRCGAVGIAVTHRAAPPADQALAEARAAALVAAFRERGATARLAPAGTVLSGPGQERVDYVISP